MTRPEAMRLVREMGDDWKPSQIVRYLEVRGVTVSVRTVKRWASGESTAADNRRRTQQARDARVLARVTSLRGRNVSFTAIASVLSLDYGHEVSAEQVRYCVKLGGMSRELRKVLFGAEFVPGALRVAGPVVESRPESTRGEPLEGGYDVRLPTPSPWSES